jgi:hypothetical protein
VIHHTVVTDSIYLQRLNDAISEKILGQKPSRPRGLQYPSAGQKFTNVLPSPQGELSCSGIENAAWLGFCSGTFLKIDGRQIPMPTGRVNSGGLRYSDKTIVFDDDFGLPKSVELYAWNGQLACEYKVLQTTNFSGRSFPLKFRVVQYRIGTGSDGVTILPKAELFGRLTSIELALQPEIPEEVRLELEKLQ